MIVGTMSCLALGVTVYCGAAVRDASGDAVRRAYVAPVDETSCVAPIGRAASNVAVSVAEEPTVTIDAPTEHDERTGKLYISEGTTVTEAVVLVEANKNVNVAPPAPAVTVASIVLVPKVPSVAVAAVSSIVPEPKVAPIDAFE